MPPRPPTPRQPAQGRRSILVLHCDALALKAQGLYLDDETKLMTLFAALALQGDVVVTRCDGIRDTSLKTRLRELAEGKRKFDVVLVIGHSNEVEIQITGDHSASWREFAAYLAPFEPRQLILAACKAGRFFVARDLFAGLRQLQQIFACPVLAHRDLAEQLVMVAMMNLDGPIPEKVVTALQGFSAVTIGAQLRCWSRKDMNDPTGGFLDIAAEGLDPIVRGLPAAIQSWFTSK